VQRGAIARIASRMMMHFSARLAKRRKWAAACRDTAHECFVAAHSNLLTINKHRRILMLQRTPVRRNVPKKSRADALNLLR